MFRATSRHGNLYCTGKFFNTVISGYENARQFIRQDSNGKTRCEDYYYSYNSGILTDWKKGGRPALLNKCQYHFEADICGHVYDKNLPAALKDTPWQYCPIADFYNYFREPMQSLPFLAAYLEHPRLERLVKTGFCHIVSGLVYRYNAGCLDETQNRTHRILKVSAEDMPFLKGLEVDIPP